MAADEFSPGKRRIEIDILEEVEVEIEPKAEKYKSKRKLKAEKFQKEDWEPEKESKDPAGADLNAIIKRFEDAGERPPAALLRSRPITYEESVARMRGEAIDSPEEVQESLDREMGNLTEHQRRILERIQDRENYHSVDYAEIESRIAAAGLVDENGANLTLDSMANAMEELRAQERVAEQAAALGRTLSGMGIQASEATRRLTRAFAILGENMNEQMERVLGTETGRFSSNQFNSQVIPRPFVREVSQNDTIDALRYGMDSMIRPFRRDREIPRDPMRFLESQCTWQFDRAFIEDEVEIRLRHNHSDMVFAFSVPGRDYNPASVQGPSAFLYHYQDVVEEFQSQLADRFGWEETRAERRGNSFRDQCDIRTIDNQSSDVLTIEITHRPTGRKQVGSVPTMEMGRARDPERLVRSTIDNLLRSLEERIEQLRRRR